jgi:hypothetical protein
MGLAKLEQRFRGVTFLDFSLYLRPVGTPKRSDTQPHCFVERAHGSVGRLKHPVDYQGLEADHIQSLRTTKLDHGHGTVDLAIGELKQPTFTVWEGVFEMVALEMSESKVSERLSIRMIEVGAHIDAGGSVRTRVQVDGRPTHEDSVGFDCEIGGPGEPDTPPDHI